MTKTAILRRQCKRAMHRLIKRFGYLESSFEIPVSRDNEHDVLPGTPIYWTPPSYYEGESDCRPARDEYREMLFCVRTDWGRIARQDDIQRKNREAVAALGYGKENERG